MRLFRDYRMHWWQLGLLKIALLCVGILIGAYLSHFIVGRLGMFVLLSCLFLAPVIYLVAVLPQLGA
jgi:hypothetical protein